MFIKKHDSLIQSTLFEDCWKVTRKSSFQCDRKALLLTSMNYVIDMTPFNSFHQLVYIISIQETKKEVVELIA